MRGTSTQVMSIFFAIIFTSILLLVFITTVKAEYPCNSDESIPDCVPCFSSCIEFLNNQDRKCSKVCLPPRDCFCNPGLLRTSTGLCVPFDQCNLYEG